MTLSSRTRELWVMEELGSRLEGTLERVSGAELDRNDCDSDSDCVYVRVRVCMCEDDKSSEVLLR